MPTDTIVGVSRDDIISFTETAGDGNLLDSVDALLLVKDAEVRYSQKHELPYIHVRYDVKDNRATEDGAVPSGGYKKRVVFDNLFICPAPTDKDGNPRTKEQFDAIGGRMLTDLKRACKAMTGTALETKGLSYEAVARSVAHDIKGSEVVGKVVTEAGGEFPDKNRVKAFRASHTWGTGLAGW
jgi:hypothetical protein